MLRLREAAAADRQYLQSLFVTLRGREWAAAALPPEVVTSLAAAQFEAQARGYQASFPAARCDVIELDGRSIGRLWVYRSSSEIRILDIGLEPAMQGLGFGSICLKQILTEAGAAGVSVRLQVAADNPARRLYRRLGFEVIKDDPPYLGMLWNGASNSHRQPEICSEQA